MNMKYYNASNHFSAPLRREPKPYSPYQRRPEVIVPQRPPSRQQDAIANVEEHRLQPRREPSAHPAPVPAPSPRRSLQNLSLNNLHADDLLLLGVIALLIWNSCDDTLLLLALAYLFFAGL